MALDLGNTRLITYESDGHGAINDLNPCIVFPVVGYLVDPAAAPPDGMVCEQQTEPFEG